MHKIALPALLLLFAFPAFAEPLASSRAAVSAKQFDAWREVRVVRRQQPRQDDDDDYAEPQPRYPQPRPGPGLLELLFTPQGQGQNPFARGGGQLENPYGNGYQEMAPRGFDPRFARATVPYEGGERPGTVVIDTRSRYLYLVQDDGKALRYGVGVGRPGFSWRGVKSVSAKKEWPDWRPPAEMLRRRPDLPVHMVGGPANPLGARAIYLGSSLYRIHGSNEPETIGQAVSSGCFRMRNEDVIDLYSRVKVGTKVVVI
ncbi:MAG TPA: L,D-transpeptidase [Xanthobacteraceae bacterium]|nr:L,D-transpeptidase [Xanthobacteraceae bacterium]